jgi:hypothetical protein
LVFFVFAEHIENTVFVFSKYKLINAFFSCPSTGISRKPEQECISSATSQPNGPPEHVEKGGKENETKSEKPQIAPVQGRGGRRAAVQQFQRQQFGGAGRRPPAER